MREQQRSTEESDMAAVQITSRSQIVRDPRSGILRSWYDDSVAPQTDRSFAPRDLARNVLLESASLFHWNPPLADLVEGELLHRAGAYSVRFTQEFKGIPVDTSEIVVNLFEDSRVYSIYNNYHYDIPDALDPRNIKVNAERARAIVERLVGHFERRPGSGP